METQVSSEGSSPSQGALTAFAELNLPSHLTLGRIIAIVEGTRNKPIVIDVAEWLNGGNLCGLWLSTDSREIILHAATPSELHRQQFILHELGHMVLRHDETARPSDYAALLFPNVDGERVSRILQRSDFFDHIEAAAESMADLFAAAIRASTTEPRSFEKILG
ncbi:hypothetical protein [Paenarthrobacter sp. PH39-S1]|uniref:hypothetical protein n=1 Tax=Paenarthrobacter sp. PH39-S1 TaxID=3046204 RepID=UPI0024B91781|nr:hypothetical protein [Paenarthrobacter sp. PH39-S1]MDJ0356319.1 hypothetical protein [Paenarthrobacter sp. PH39-S1]